MQRGVLALVLRLAAGGQPRAARRRVVPAQQLLGRAPRDRDVVEDWEATSRADASSSRTPLDAPNGRTGAGPVQRRQPAGRAEAGRTPRRRTGQAAAAADGAPGTEAVEAVETPTDPAAEQIVDERGGQAGSGERRRLARLELGESACAVDRLGVPHAVHGEHPPVGGAADVRRGTSGGTRRARAPRPALRQAWPGNNERTRTELTARVPAGRGTRAVSVLLHLGVPRAVGAAPPVPQWLSRTSWSCTSSDRCRTERAQGLRRRLRHHQLHEAAKRADEDGHAGSSARAERLGAHLARAGERPPWPPSPRRARSRP